MRSSLAAAALCAAVATVPLRAQEPPAAACDPRAKPYLDHGWVLLHAFEYEWARQEFMTASAIDADCAMAHVGEALSFEPMLWEPPSKDDLALGWAAIERARQAKKAAPVERGLADAVEVLFKTYERVPRINRFIAFHNAIQRLHTGHRDDPGLAAFYGLSILALDTGKPAPNLERRLEAVRVLEPYARRFPEHPGITLGLVEALDANADLARKGLEHARRLAALAPNLPHAQHAAARLYVRLGMWPEALGATQASERAADELMKSLDWPPAQRYRRDLEWHVYALVQLGRMKEAGAFVNHIGGLVAESDSPAFRAAWIEAQHRWLVDGRQWQAALEVPTVSEPQRESILVDHARVLGAAFLGDVDATQAASRRLMAFGQSVHERKDAEAAFAFVQNDFEQVNLVLRRFTHALDAAPEPGALPPRAIPTHELYGEMLLRLGEPALAAEQFSKSAQLYARRPATILGAARAAAGVGNRTEAASRLAEFFEIFAGADPDADLLVEASRLRAPASSSAPPSGS